MTTAPPESDDAGAPAAAQEKALRESLEDASVLLWFATREGRKVEDGVLKDIVSAQSVLREGGRNPEVEGRFWAAFRELAKAVQPASIDSILATYSYPFGYHHSESGKHRWVDAAATKKKYSYTAVVALGFLIIVQIYWFIGTTWRTDLGDNRAEIDRIAGDLREMSVKIEVANDLAGRNRTQIRKDIALGVVEPVPGVPARLGSNDLDMIQKQLVALREVRGRTLLDAKNAILRDEGLQEMLYVNSRMLNFWDFVTDLVNKMKGGSSDLSLQELIATAKSFDVSPDEVLKITNVFDVSPDELLEVTKSAGISTQELIKITELFEEQSHGCSVRPNV